MDTQNERSKDTPTIPLTTLGRLRAHAAQTVIIAGVLAGVVVVFAYVGGWIGPHRLSADDIVNVIEGPQGPHLGFRRAHAKGICIAGSFVGSPQARMLSKATVFQGAAVPVTGRMAEATPDPFANDAAVGVRSMALRLQPVGGDEWRTAMNDTPGDDISTPQAFYDEAVAGTPDPNTGKPDPRKMAAFLAAHPEAVAFQARAKAKPLASGFVDDSYNGIDGFIFVDPAGHRRLVRWSMVSEAPFATLTPEARAKAAPNYIFDDLLARVREQPLRWRMVATLAQPGDVNRAAVVWPAGRETVDMGELTIDRVYSEATGNCQDLTFDPLVLPAGIAPSDDPLPYARSAVYGDSFRRRAGEAKPPSAVSNQSARTIR
jgi:catalase